MFFPSEYHLLVYCQRVNRELCFSSFGFCFFFFFLEKSKRGREEQGNNYTYREETVMMEGGIKLSHIGGEDMNGGDRCAN